MKRCVVICCAAAILVLPAVALTAEEPAAAAPQKKGKVIAEVKAAESAVVKAIDLEKRTLTLAMPDGKDRTFVIDRKVRKLDQVKVGDVVSARYREAVTVRLKKTKVAPGVSVGEAVTRDEKSVKPAGTAARTVTTIATIDKIHDDGKWVTLRMPGGDTVDVKVRDPENLAKLQKGEVKEGDQIEITYTQALAVSVEKATPK